MRKVDCGILFVAVEFAFLVSHAYILHALVRRLSVRLDANHT